MDPPGDTGSKECRGDQWSSVCDVNEECRGDQRSSACDVNEECRGDQWSSACVGANMEKITSRRNPLCMHIKKLGASRSYREACGEFLCDGIKLLEEAVKNDAEITNVLTAVHIPFPLPLETRVHFTDRKLIDSVSPLTNSPGLLFTCRFPQQSGNDKGNENSGADSPIENSVTSDHNENNEFCENREFRENRDGLDSIYGFDGIDRIDSFDSFGGTHILLDGVQDPGNVGAIIRTADAFGIKSVILTGDCADPYNPKTIRATMGAIFRQNIRHMSGAALAGLKADGARFIGAAPGGQSKDVSTVRLKNTIIAIGSEGRGLSGEVLALCDEIVTIPIAPACESLNAAVAAAILMYLARN